MRKTILLSISLLAFCVSCTNDSDTVEGITTNKEQTINENDVADLAKASISLTNQYKGLDLKNESLSSIVKTVDGLAIATDFLKEFSLVNSDNVSLTDVQITKIIKLDLSVLNDVNKTAEFEAQVIEILTGTGDFNFYIKQIYENPKLNVSERKLLLDAIDFSVSSTDHSVDDEWRKRKFTAYLVSQSLGDLSIVTSTTVLNIAMEQ